MELDMKPYFTTIFLLFLLSSAFSADLTFDKPRVIDGDTISVTLSNLPPPLNKLSIRLYGIDTPELRGKCLEEKELAVRAKAFLKSLVEGNTIIVSDYSWDKYGGRILGKVFILKTNLSDLMILQGFAVPYYGKGTKENWCKISNF